MKTTKYWVVALLCLLFPLSALAGFFGEPQPAPTTSQITPLTDKIINLYKGDVDGLWKAWLEPQLVWSRWVGVGWYVDYDSGELKDMRPADNKLIIDEFGRFCEANGWKTNPSVQQYGNKNSCTSTKGELIFEIETKRWDGGLAVKLDTPKTRVAQIELAKQKQAKEFAAANKPTDIKSFIEKYQSNDPGSLVPQAASRLHQAELLEYRSDYEEATKKNNVYSLKYFVTHYSNNDPDLLVPKAQKLIQDFDQSADKEEVARKANEQQQIASFRKALAEGDDTSCGLVIEKKAKLVKIQIKTSNNEQWVKLDDIYPAGQSCSIDHKESINTPSRVVQGNVNLPQSCPTEEQKVKMESSMNEVMQSVYSYG